MLNKVAVVLALCLIVTVAQADVRFASFNTRHLGWNNDKDIPAMAHVINRFDLVGLQEVMHASAAKDMAHTLTRMTGEPWGVVTSHPVGDSSYKEGYAFIWRKNAVQYVGGAVLYLDPGNRFAREPFSAQFKAPGTGLGTFVAATVHITYGDGPADRAPEIHALADYWQWLGKTFPDDPRILMGDFNTPPDSQAWQPLRALAHPNITTGRSTLSKSAGAYAHLYDNIWTGSRMQVSDSGIGHYPEWLGLSHKRAYSTVSDHAPVYIIVDN